MTRSASEASAGTGHRGPVTVRVPSTGAVEPVEALVAAVAPVDEAAAAAARQYHDALAKPPGSLGHLESVGAQLAAIACHCPPPEPSHPWLLLAAGDHGVHREGVNAWPQEVTAVIVAAACGGRSVSGALAGAGGIDMTVLDAGLAHDPGDLPALVRRPGGAGTRNLHREPAMTLEQCRATITASAAVVHGMVDDGADLLLLGEMGMANTTVSAGLIAAVTGAAAADVTGTGAGADGPILARKLAVVEAAAGRAADLEPLAVLATIGGYEHAALVGAMLAAAGRRIPVVLDGVVTNAAALIAVGLQPSVAGYLIASHRSAEPGATVALSRLGLRPLLDLDLRLGEGSGALLATPLVTAAAAVLARTATLDELAAQPDG